MVKGGRHIPRRGVMKGLGAATLPLSKATVSSAQEAIADQPHNEDPHALDTFASVVDAIVPRTPELEDELGPEHVPGGLDVGLERFLIWDFNHFHEIRLEQLASGPTADQSEQMSREWFEMELAPGGATTSLEALSELGVGTATGDYSDAFAGNLTFGPVERFSVDIHNEAKSEGPAEFDVQIQLANETVHMVVSNYPYSNAVPFVLDVVAAEFIATGRNEDPPGPNEEFPAGGSFVRLSRKDRLRCLWTMVEGSIVNDLDDLLRPLMPTLGFLDVIVLGINGFTGLGYYSEWSGYGETKMAPADEREMQRSEDQVQSRLQTDYPGPAHGHAADWRHVVPGGFTDSWPVTNRGDQS